MSIITIENAIVSESDQFVDFIITLDGPSTSTVTVSYSTFDGSAKSGNSSDYVSHSGVLSFAPGETLKTVRVAVTNEIFNYIENSENFYLQLSAPSIGNYLGNPIGVATIIDNDGPTGTPTVCIHDMIVDETTREAIFVITLDRPAASAVSMNFSTVNGSALAGSDYSATSGLLTFATGEVAKTVRVSLLNDNISEYSETFNLILSSVSGASLPDNSATATISENDQTAQANSVISVENMVIGEGDLYFDFAVRLDRPNTSVVSVNYTTTSGTATSDNGLDYALQSGTLTFAPGETIKQVRIIPTNDTYVTTETNESFYLTLNTPSGNAMLGNSSGIATIIDNEGTIATPLLSMRDLIVDESSHEAVFVITLDRPSSTPVTVDYATADGSALAGSDYVATSGKVTFAIGETAKCVRVALINDALAETSEHFMLVLSNVVDASLLDSDATVTIAGNDQSSRTKSVISVNALTVDESVGYAEFVVSLDGPNANAVSVNYSTSNSTAIDYNSFDYLNQSGILTFAPGETNKTVRVIINNDAYVEYIESFNFQLSTPSSNAVLGNSKAVATIIDNDGALGSPLMSMRDVLIDESTREAVFTVQLDHTSTAPVSVDYVTQNGTALADSDYGAVSGTLSFAPGELIKTVRVPLYDDALTESSESFQLVLGNVNGAALLDNGATAIIAENDQAAQIKSIISIENAVVDEGTGYIDFIVRLDNPNSTEVSVNYATADGTATNSSSADYIAQTGTLKFSAGETIKTVRVALVDNATTSSDRDESFSLQLSSPSSNAMLGNSMAAATIIDNDGATGIPLISISDPLVDENAHEVTFVVRLDRPSITAVSVRYSTVDGTAFAESDYSELTGTISFSPGEIVKTIRIGLVDDGQMESAESFGLTLSGASGATLLDNRGTATIAPSDQLSRAASIVSIEDLLVGEGTGYVDFVVHLDAPNTEPVSVNYNLPAGGTALSLFNSDYVGQAGTITFAAGETMKSVRVMLNDDKIAEMTESLFLQLNAASSNAVIGKSLAAATIIDNDSTVLTPLLAVEGGVFDEDAGTAVVTFRLNKSSDATVTASYTIADLTARLGSDYGTGENTGLITFAPGETVKTVIFSILNDALTEQTEAIILNVTGTTNAIVSTGTAGIAIYTNDSIIVPNPVISVSDAVATEESGYLEFLVTLSAPSASQVSVSYQELAGTADGTDLTAITNILCFAPGETIAKIRLPLTQDGQAENLEKFYIQLINPVGATLANALATGLIIDGDSTLTTSPAINGSSSNDLLHGTSAAESFSALSGNDFIDGGAGGDTMSGGAGDDTYMVDQVGDVIIENPNEGTDTVISSFNYTLSDNLERLLLGVGATNGIGNILDNDLIGNIVNNTLNGAAGNDTLNGSFGADTMYGGTGNDTFYRDDTGDYMIENSGEGIDTVISSLNYTLGTNLEKLLLGTGATNGGGNSLDNTITGNAANNLLAGATGNDTLNGGIGADTMIGGLGNDTYWRDNAADVITENAGEGSDTVISNLNYTLLPTVENLTLSGSATNGGGNALDNNITGNALANLLAGAAGNDTLIGGAGADSLYGGLGNDTYFRDNIADLILENISEGSDTVYSSVNYTLAANIENLTLQVGAINGGGNTLSNTIIGNAAANLLAGAAGNDTIDGGSGADSLYGGLGDDSYFRDNIADVIIENIGEGSDTVFSSVNYTLASNVEHIVLTGGATNSGGNALANSISGNTLNNLLSGGAGADTLTGGLGNDTLYGGVDTDRFVFDTTANSITNVDTLADWSAGDIIALDNDVYTALGAAGPLATAQFYSAAGLSGSNAIDQGAGIYYDSSTGNLYYDADGLGGIVSVKFAMLVGAPSLSASAFVVQE